MDSSLLPAPAPAPRPIPKRALSLFLVPAAALALGVLVERILDLPGGDPVLRWLAISSAAGLGTGALAGVWLSARLPWTLYGAASPWVVSAVVLLGARVVRPVREAASVRAADQCRASGRTLCSLSEFRAACEASAREKLGPPQHESCSPSGCTRRWSYAGPWTPDNYVAPGSVLCSVVTDGQGRVVRQTTLAGNAVE